MADSGENPTAMEPHVDLVRKSFGKDVLNRGILNTSAREPCVCGLYQYYSQKCGCVYKSVFLKCGRTLSEKTGDPILCPAGHRRKIKVETALVPFRCRKCRKGMASEKQ
ncbi:hypothetical protein F5Y05DRAFT_398875 [Hypoxylon sp. FL0543]|nr:hypothetical protein F5Y05DRAFT_398875 [Hypoxylon sp. FL0543]